MKMTMEMRDGPIVMLFEVLGDDPKNRRVVVKVCNTNTEEPGITGALSPSDALCLNRFLGSALFLSGDR